MKTLFKSKGKLGYFDVDVFPIKMQQVVFWTNWGPSSCGWQYLSMILSAWFCQVGFNHFKTKYFSSRISAAT